MLCLAQKNDCLKNCLYSFQIQVNENFKFWKISKAFLNICLVVNVIGDRLF